MSRRGNRKDENLLREILAVEERIEHDLAPKPPTQIRFKEISMNPTVGGNTQVFTGVLSPAGSAFPSDAVFSVSSNDPAVSPTVDSTGLIVTGSLPTGWVESTTTPLAYSYEATSASNPGWLLSATITPSAPPVGLPSSIAFTQTQ